MPMIHKPTNPTGRAPSDDESLSIARVGASDGYLSDLYHFLLVSSWSRLLVMLGIVYVGSNCLFALAYLLAGDSIQGGRPGSFADAFFFSVETMATIGYGHMVPRTLWANILMAIESLVGLLGLAVVTGLTFAKFSRPTARVLFSRVSVIAPWDGVPSLVFRMANQRGNQIVEARVHVVLARNETTAEGDVFRRLHDLQLIRDQTALFALTWTAIHPISDISPLNHATRKSLAESEAEIIVSLTGLDESFSQTVHARHSYRAEDIVWGARFVDILSRLPDGRRQVDYTRFHDVIQTDGTGVE
jgi:inward rectifier potassium channel